MTADLDEILTQHKNSLLAGSSGVMKRIESDKTNIALRSDQWALQWYVAGVAGVQKAVENTLNKNTTHWRHQRDEFLNLLESSVKNLSDILAGSPIEYKFHMVNSNIDNALYINELSLFLRAVYRSVNTSNISKISDYLSKQTSLGVPLTNLAHQWYLTGTKAVLRYIKKDSYHSLRFVNDELIKLKSHYAKEFLGLDKKYLIFPEQRVILV